MPIGPQWLFVELGRTLEAPSMLHASCAFTVTVWLHVVEAVFPPLETVTVTLIVYDPDEPAITFTH